MEGMQRDHRGEARPCQQKGVILQCDSISPELRMETEGWEEEMVPWEGSGPERRGRAQPAAGHKAGPPGTPAGALSSSDIFYCCTVCVRPVVKPRHRGWKETQPNPVFRWGH